MKYNVLDTKGKIVEDITLADDVFGFKLNEKVLGQYLRVFSFNQRQGTSSTKDRSEVSGGGKKPWKQKGTGRARQGSTRSPIWTHGGVAHGPTPKSWRLSLPKKMTKIAIKSALSQKFLNKDAIIIDTIDVKKPSTKQMTEMLNNLKVEGKSMFVWSVKDEGVLKSCANIKDMKVCFAGNVNAYDLVNVKKVIFIKDSVKVIEGKYAK